MCVLLSSDVALRDFHHMVDSSRSIVEGTVIGHRGGFFRQDMGFLVTVEIDNVLAHDDATPRPEGRILVFYPGPGSFTVLGKELCLPNRGRGSLPAVPTAEDRVILFSGYQVIEAGSEPISVFDGNVVVGRADGSIAMPAKLRDDPALKGTATFDDVRREIARRRPS